MIKPKEHNEKRSEERYGYRCAIIRENLETGMVVIGQMHNYSIGGFYFESNTILQTGDIVFLGTPDSPYRLEAPLYECHRVQIKWRNALVRSRYRFAYGVQHLDPIGIDPDFTERYYCDMPEYLDLITGVSPELRRFERKRMSTSVYFTAREHLFKGLIRDVSRRGIFIETKNRLKVGRFIRLVIPGTKIDNGIMLKARIVHRTLSGFGVKLVGIQKM